MLYNNNVSGRVVVVTFFLAFLDSDEVKRKIVANQVGIVLILKREHIPGRV